MKTVENIQSLVNKSIKGTSLSGAKVALGGQTAYINDTRNVASKDFIRTAIIMLTGILLALMLITRSILQPFYILGTLLLAYIMSLDITHLISKAFLGQSMLTWNTPFFSFIMLIALGVDYSIFLMMKYQEYDGFLATPGARIVKAANRNWSCCCFSCFDFERNLRCFDAIWSLDVDSSCVSCNYRINDSGICNSNDHTKSFEPDISD